MAYIIASAVTDVFRCVIDTIFICAFQDMEEHSPPKFRSGELRSSFGISENDRDEPKLMGGQQDQGDRSPSKIRGMSTEMNARM